MLDMASALKSYEGVLKKTSTSLATENGRAEGFPERLKHLRVQRNLSQLDLAALAGLSNMHISRYERGSSKPSAANLKRLADILEVSTDYLFEGTEEGAARVNLEDRRVLELFQDVERLPEHARTFVIDVIDALLTNYKFKELARK